MRARHISQRWKRHYLCTVVPDRFLLVKYPNGSINQMDRIEAKQHKEL
jgi:hypothetical protein